MMQSSPMLALHIAGGTAGLLSGFTAIFLRKGSPRHRITGNIFVISMIVLGFTGALLGVMKHQPSNGGMGILTCYLVITGWWIARRRDGEAGVFDYVALTVPLLVGFVLFLYGLGFVHSAKEPRAGSIFSGSIALLWTIADLRMLVRSSITGTQRLARHLSRMCFALFVASGSIFIARPHLFPMFMRKSGILFVLGFLPLLLLIFWRWRIRSHRAQQKLAVPQRKAIYSMQAGSTS